MELTYKDYTIEIRNDSNYWPHSKDNLNSYDFEYPLDTEPFSREACFTTTAIIIKKDTEVVCSAIICEPNASTVISNKNFLIANDRIYVCVRDLIYALNIPNLTISWKKQIDIAYCVAIYRLEQDLLVHGELEIHRIDLEGNVKWKFSGADIFININDKQELSIGEDYVKLIDFNGKKYTIGFDGKIIKKKKWWKI